MPLAWPISYQSGNFHKSCLARRLWPLLRTMRSASYIYDLILSKHPRVRIMPVYPPDDDFNLVDRIKGYMAAETQAPAYLCCFFVNMQYQPAHLEVISRSKIPSKPRKIGPLLIRVTGVVVRRDNRSTLIQSPVAEQVDAVA